MTLTTVMVILVVLFIGTEVALYVAENIVQSKLRRAEKEIQTSQARIDAANQRIQQAKERVDIALWERELHN